MREVGPEPAAAAVENQSQEAHVASARRWAHRAWLAAVFGTGLFLLSVAWLGAQMHPSSIVPLLGLVLGLAVQLAGAAFGALALITRRGTDAMGVVPSSVAAIGVGVCAFLVACCMGLWLSGFGP